MVDAMLCWKGVPVFRERSLMSASPFQQQSQTVRFAARWMGLPDG